VVAVRDGGGQNSVSDVFEAKPNGQAQAYSLKLDGATCTFEYACQVCTSDLNYFPFHSAFASGVPCVLGGLWIT
jgi:hypothetical protein